MYANTYKCKLDKFCKLNNKLLRIALNKKLPTSVSDLYKLMNVLPITDLHDMRFLLFVRKCIFHRQTFPGILHANKLCTLSQYKTK